MRIRVLAHAGGRGTDERARRGEPLTFGVPLPTGAVSDHASWTLHTGEGVRPVQIRALDRWVGGSLRWALVDVQAALNDSPVQELFLEVRDGQERKASANTATSDALEKSAAIALSEAGGAATVDTGAAKFELRPGRTFPFASVESNGHSVLEVAGTGLTVTDAQGASHRVETRSIVVEERGFLRSVVKLAGAVRCGGRQLDVVARVHFFAGLPTVRMLVTITNPNRAQHAGGFWDLGDAGSILIKDASLAFQLRAPSGDVELYASSEVGAPWTKFNAPFELYQDSSGGDNWQSSNHLNRERRVPTTFRGYRLRAGERAQAGLRATPIVALARGDAGVAATSPHFWQNFPKAIEADDATLTFRLFPGQFSDLHELQGGEQKTHELFVAFGPDGVSPVPLAWCRSRTIAGAAPEWSVESKAVPFLAPLDADHAALVNSAIDGPDRFEAKREKIDEYGWRHFGDIYGDHEAVRHKGGTPLVSHYNNQYDPVAGFAYQFLRTGDPRWWTAMSELASHLVDIDVYHTTRDKWAYNHGMFWHTYHYGDADTSTHRSYPKAAQGKVHGGGPAADHNYPRGLVFHYFLTGDHQSREAAIGLAQFVIDMDDGRKTIFGWLDRGDTGRAAMSDARYYGPGRGPANSLEALVEAHRLTGDERFRAKAEQLVRRVVHPEDDMVALRLDEPEERWYYLMFLQSLGRYLHYRDEQADRGDAYVYGRESLIHYASWMAQHEYPYLEKPERLEFATETWAAQDIRKCDILGFAALYAEGDARRSYLERAAFFHRSTVSTLRTMATRVCTRPVAILLTSGHVPVWFRLWPDAQAGRGGELQNAGVPQVFVGQRDRVERRLKWAVGVVLGVAALVALAWVMLRGA